MTTTMMMEASSPLAAMQPSNFMNRCGFGQDHGPSYAAYARAHHFGPPSSFNFKDLSMMKRPQPDYFNMAAPVRGSSPTASLAADLSQNMHIDKSSPQYPTPRRSLFSNNNMFNSYDMSLTTPPVASSPAPQCDGMDMSPLPHKPAYGSNPNLALQSPTPEPTPTEFPFPASDLTPRPTSSPPSSDIILHFPRERRKSASLRPGLTRAKGYSTNNIPQKSHPEAQLPPFKFGNGIHSASSSSLALAEIFECSSPVQDRVSSRVASPLMPTTRPRQPFNLGSRNVSPNSPHARRLSKELNNAVRPRKQFRRSLSMFEHPDEVMRQEKESNIPSLPSIADIEAPYIPTLPHFYTGNQSCDLPRISSETMIDILDGKYDTMYEKRVVIDCRFEYEYKGGHIDGAVNFNDKEQLASQLFDHEQPGKALLIFHCEYSAHRAPLMARHIRSQDRVANAESYPNLTYPEAYILDGGYSSFYRQHRERCFPQNYVEMDASEHAQACELGMHKVKNQQRAKLTRAQTFAFGSHSPSIDSSPTAMGRSRSGDDMDMDMGLELTPIAARPAFSALQVNRGQRMFSY